MRARDERTVTENFRCWCFIVFLFFFFRLFNSKHLTWGAYFTLRDFHWDPYSLFSGSTRTEHLIHCLRAQAAQGIYTVPYLVPAKTFCFKRVHCENVVIQEFGDQSIKISRPSHPKRVKESTVIASGTEGISVTVISLFEFFLKNFITLMYFSQSQ